VVWNQSEATRGKKLTQRHYKYQGKILNRETNNQNKGIPKQRRKYREGYNLGNRLNTQPNAQSKNTKKEGNEARLASFAETAVVIPNING
jgi:hypothetical protein